jgi:hypothetical protein
VAARPPDHEPDPGRKGLVEVAEDKIQVTGIKGPLEEGWQQKVAAFAARIPIQG